MRALNYRGKNSSELIHRSGLEMLASVRWKHILGVQKAIPNGSHRFCGFQVTNTDPVKGFLKTENREEAFLSPPSTQTRTRIKVRFWWVLV